MKSFILVAALSAFYGVEAVSNSTESTVVCPDCVKPASTNDIVTREPVPTTSCTAPELTTVPDNSGWTTSTVKTTKVYTVTSCAPTVTNCPVGHVTTETTHYTTVCPVSTPGPNPPASSGNPPAPTGGIQTSVVPGTGVVPGPTGPSPPVSTVPVTGAGSIMTGSVAAIAMAVAAACLL